jgi:hypothetical protein
MVLQLAVIGFIPVASRVATEIFLSCRWGCSQISSVTNEVATKIPLASEVATDKLRLGYFFKLHEFATYPSF